jgi:HSP20 family protein
MATQSNLAKTSPTSSEKAGKGEKTAQRPAIPPAVDVFENENELLVIADLPGVTQDNLSIQFDKGQLTIYGRRSPPAWTPLLVEGDMADFRRTFVVPQGIDSEHIAADLAQGVLQVHLPKHASAKARRIEVKAS